MAARSTAHGFEHTQRGDDKGVMRRDEFGEVGLRSAISEEVSESVSPGFDNLAGIFLRADVDYHYFAPFVRRVDQRFQRGVVECGPVTAVGTRIVDNNFDVVRALGYARIDPRLSFVWGRECRDRNTIFSAVSAGRGRESSC